MPFCSGVPCVGNLPGSNTLVPPLPRGSEGRSLPTRRSCGRLRAVFRNQVAVGREGTIRNSDRSELFTLLSRNGVCCFPRPK